MSQVCRLTCVRLVLAPTHGRLYRMIHFGGSVNPDVIRLHVLVGLPLRSRCFVLVPVVGFARVITEANLQMQVALVLRFVMWIGLRVALGIRQTCHYTMANM